MYVGILGVTYTLLADTAEQVYQYQLTRHNHNYLIFQAQICNDVYVILRDGVGGTSVWQVIVISLARDS